MKLYATVTSERATKGQGGNKFLNIELKAEKIEGKPTPANIYLLRLEIIDDKLFATLLDYSNGTIQNLITFRPAPKGKQQKGECVMGSACAKNGNCNNPTHNCEHLEKVLYGNPKTEYWGYKSTNYTQTP